MAFAQVTSGTWTGGAGNGLWSGTNNWNPNITINTTGTFALTLTGTVGQIVNEVVVTNDINGSVNLTTLTFANTGTLAPNQNALFRLNSGTLNFTGGGQIITAAASSALPFGQASDGDRIFSTVNISSGTTEIFTNSNHNLTFGGTSGGGNITGNGTLRIDGLGTTVQYVYLGGSNNYTGGTLIDGAYAVTGLRNDSSNNNAFGSGKVTVQHEGTLLLRNNSKITNALDVSGIGSGTNSANRGSLIGSFGAAGGTAEYAGTISVLGDTRFTTTSSAAGDQTSKMVISGDVNLNSSLLTLKSRKNASATEGLLIEISGKVSGAGGIIVDGEGAYSLVKLSGSNSYTGGTTVTTGTLILGNSSALGTGFLKVDSSSGLDLNGFTASAGALSGSSSGIIRSQVAGTARLITNSTTSGTFAGTIQNGAGIVGYTKTGSGKQFLTGTNTYTDTTLVQGGSLYINGLLSNTGTSTVNVSGGVLSGSGTIARDVTIASGGTISAGADDNLIGTLTVGSLTLQSGATAAMSITGTDAGTFDQIASTSSVQFGGALAIDMQYSGTTIFDPSLGGTFWTLFTSGSNSWSGDLDSITMTGVYGTLTFKKVDDGRWGSQTAAGGQEFAFFTSGVNAGKLYAVPEPSAIALAAAGGAVLLGAGLRRKRRKNHGDTDSAARGG